MQLGINHDRDVIFVDQRGTLHADPLLSCPEIDQFVDEATDMSILAASTAQRDLDAVRACRTRLASAGYDLSAYNTTENAADIADLVRKTIASGADPGAPEMLRRYDWARRPDVLSRSFVIDVANRSLLSDLLPMQSLRAAGMHLIGGIGPLRRLAMREGLSPSWRLPREQ